MRTSGHVVWVCAFAIAFAFVESSVVVYLRDAYYPEGFSFPLKPQVVPQVIVEIVRELATLVMLASVAVIAGRNRWQRFSYFLIAFGVWDIFYYVWLKAILDWPASFFEWDVLFLIPVPWIGPVIAPLLVSVIMILGGLLLLKKERRIGRFRAPAPAIGLMLVGTAAILASFMLDLNASLKFQYPKPYHYELLAVGLLAYLGAMFATVKAVKN